VSTLVPTSAGSDPQRALVLRQSIEDRLPAEARRRGGPPGRPLRHTFVIDGPSVRATPAAPVVVLAVNVVAGPASLADGPRAAGAPAMAAFIPRVIEDPYAAHPPGDRGTLVDAYV
jgi:hypothetical protein